MYERNAMINCRVHGGNLRVDAVICQIKYGDYRHGDANYDVFFKDHFKKMYHSSPNDGYWLAKHGDDSSRGLDWPLIIGFIDKFVYVIDSVTEDGTPAGFKDVLDTHFPAFMAHVTHLITQARGDANWQVDAADMATLTTLQKAVLTGCSTWKVRGDPNPLWASLSKPNKAWSPADYLRDLASKQQRIVGPAGATMKLRPQARVDYKT
ncbi:hypothetical protein Daus18300_010182 [Diaporthe australafricana]|uniref:Uncharacterized protein n=1 Tax=Diaporthe australafricana TaxID=127596 RepID=A0ABR3WB41_9PEZI